MCEINAKKLGYVVVTDYVKANTGEDIGAELQAIIDKNPQSVIYFPDGEYQLSVPLITNAHGTFSVALELSANAVIKAHKDWDASNGALIHLGEGQHTTGEVNTPGSNYYIKGGTIDGSGVADGICIYCGRETSVRELNIINTNIGFQICRPRTGNGTSSDSDIDKLTIVGNGSDSSVGLLIEGWDNTFSNINISNVRTGVKVCTAANYFHNIQCTAPADMSTGYDQSVGFNGGGTRNWFINCSSTNFSTGFLIDSNDSMLTSCVAQWTDDLGGMGDQIAIRSTHEWNSMAKALAAKFTAPAQNCYYLVAQEGGKGQLIDSVFDVDAVNRETYNKLKGYLFASNFAAQIPGANEKEELVDFDDAGYVIVTDHIKPDTEEDLSDAIQKLVDENPGRTLYFPDGIYLISKSIKTSADPAKSVSFKFSNYAQLKAMDSWSVGRKKINSPEDLKKPELKPEDIIAEGSTPLLHIGAKDKDAAQEGLPAHCSVEGGIFHGSNKADAIWVDGASKAYLKYIAIKFACIGIYVKGGVSGKEPTVDVYNVNVIGSNTEDSIGVILETDSNKLNNMRLVSNHISIMISGSDNFLRNIHPLHSGHGRPELTDYYNTSVAFYDTGTRNFYDGCYNDQYSIGFYMGRQSVSVYESCFNFWFLGTKDKSQIFEHIGFLAEGQFNSSIRFAVCDFLHGKEMQNFPVPTNCNFLLVGEDNGSGKIEGLYFKYENTVKDREQAFKYLINDSHIEK